MMVVIFVGVLILLALFDGATPPGASSLSAGGDHDHRYHAAFVLPRPPSDAA